MAPFPLRVHVLFHPGSAAARAEAEALFLRLNGPSADLGVRIPVRFGTTDEDGAPDPDLDLPGSERSLVVVLVDRRMARRGDATERRVARAWADLLEDLLDRYPPGASAVCSVLPVAMHPEAFGLSGRLGRRSFVSYGALGPQHLEFHVVVGCLRLLAGRPASAAGDADTPPPGETSVFVSHAKADLSSGVVDALQLANRDLPVKQWFDSRDIPPGADFAAEIVPAVERADAVIVVLTDQYSNREWCRRELLAAKASGRPIVVVDAITAQVVRLFPYIGNAPTIRWRAALAETIGDGVPAEWRAQDAAKVLLEALFEALRYEHELKRLPAGGAGLQVLGTHPELVTLPGDPAVTEVVYPDPPLSREELEYLQAIRPGVTFATPLEQVGRDRLAENLGPVALSLSASPDADRYGGSRMHLASTAHDLALYLLLNGARLLYGGYLGHGGLDGGRAPGDDVNYVDRLMELVQRHSPAAVRRGAPIAPVENWLAWPLSEELTDDQLDRFTGAATRRAVPPPADLAVPAATTVGGRYPDDTPEWWYVRARCLTEMRERSTEAAAARIALGGQLSGWSGALPGVAEEALLTLRAGRPLYLLGAFGGAARAVLDELNGTRRAEFTTAWTSRHVPRWDAVRAEYARHGRPFLTPEELAAEFRSRGAGGPAAALANGLTDEENGELAATTDARRAVELVLRGMVALSPPP